jgi:hypothetical protein
MNKMTQLAKMSLIMLFALLLTVVRPVNAGTLPQVIVVDHITVPAVGQTFIVNITIAPPTGGMVQNFKGYQIMLSYNNSVVNCTNAQILAGNPFDGLGVSSSKSIENSLGQASFMCITLDPADFVNVTTTMPLCKFTFNGTHTGFSTLTYVDFNVGGGTYIINAAGEMITSEAVTGDVTILPEFGVLMMLSMLIAVTSAVLAAKKLRKI